MSNNLSYLADIIDRYIADPVSFSPAEERELAAAVRRLEMWAIERDAFLLEANPAEDEVAAVEAMKPHLSKVAAAVRRTREAFGPETWRIEPSEWVARLGEAALWHPDFWKAFADLAVLARTDPAVVVWTLASRWPESPRWLRDFGKGPRLTMAQKREDEAQRADRFRDELAAVFSALKGSRRAGCPRGTQKAKTENARLGRATLLTEFEAELERQSAREPVGASARAAVVLARRHKPRPVTVSAIRKALAEARKERREEKPI